MNEFELIQHFFTRSACAQGGENISLGIGDDCALLQIPAGYSCAVSTDTLVSGIHFPEHAPAFLLGQRALAVAVSDLAAMGAEPIGFTLALTLPHIALDWLQGFSEGLSAMAQHCGIGLVGGDTTRGPLAITVTVLGAVPQQQALLRSTAQVGDLLCVSGPLGAAAAALPVVLGEIDTQVIAAHTLEQLLAAYWTPQPQLQLGQYLRGKAHAALDISDGLLADCGHIAQASNVCLQIQQAQVPVADAARSLLGDAAALEAALSGGDDYQLAFTIAAQKLAPLQCKFPAVRAIGQVCAGSGVQVLDPQGRLVAQQRSGYQHFN
ncbi:MAG: thiamine-phosphate kinase [Gammaproteobacteria bacterium]|nr:thiamine-phosphate kinase [Gammaproteobacteria bacterium]